jgi:zinc protease
MNNNLPESYRYYRLENGLKVISIINRNFPVVIVSVHANTGYCWEPDELTGISHVVEHNLMHSSEKRKEKEIFSIDRRIAGAMYDAGTSYDYTEYLLMVPSQNLSMAMDILCDGFGKPVFHPEVFKSEMGAIKQESKRKIDMPQAMLREKLYSVAYKLNRVKRWRLGPEETLDSLTPGDLDTYFYERYVPKNYILLVAGNIEHETVEQEVRNSFASLPDREIFGTYSQSEPVQHEVRYMEIRRQVGQVYWMCGFHTPKYLQKENAPMELLAIILGQGFNSRLNLKVREEKGLVDEISAHATDFDENTLFNIFMKTDTKRLKDAEKAVMAEIFALAVHPVTQQELLRARSIIQNNILFLHDDIRQEVGFKSIVETRTGSFLNCDKYLKEILALNSEDILKSAKEYFRPDNISICTIIPERDSFEKRDIEDFIPSINEAFKMAEEKIYSSDEQVLLEGKTLTLLFPEGKPLDKVRDFRLSNGTEILLLENNRIPIFTAALLLRGGKSQEDKSNCGITSLMQSAMLKGSKYFNGRELLGKLETLGVSVRPVIKEDYFGFILKGTSWNFNTSFGILQEILLSPSFPSEEIEIEKRKILARIRGIEDNPREHCLSLFSGEVFRGHPYGLPAEGMEEVIKQLQRDDLLRWHELMLKGSNLIVSFGGDLTEDKIMREMNIIEKLPPGQKAIIPDYVIKTIHNPVENTVVKKRSQTSTAIGYATVPAGHSDYPVFQVIRGLTTGDGGRFWNEIRGKRGLAYVIHTYNQFYGKAGTFLSYTATSPDKAGLTEELLLNEFRQIYEKPPSKEELNQGKNYITGIHLAVERTTLARTIALAEAECYGAGKDYVLNSVDNIKKVTAEKVVEVAEKYFVPGGYYKAQVKGESNQ